MEHLDSLSHHIKMINEQPQHTRELICFAQSDQSRNGIKYLSVCLKTCTKVPNEVGQICSFTVLVVLPFSVNKSVLGNCHIMIETQFIS